MTWAIQYSTIQRVFYVLYSVTIQMILYVLYFQYQLWLLHSPYFMCFRYSTNTWNLQAKFPIIITGPDNHRPKSPFFFFNHLIVICDDLNMPGRYQWFPLPLPQGWHRARNITGDSRIDFLRSRDHDCPLVAGCAVSDPPSFVVPYWTFSIPIITATLCVTERKLRAEE